MKLLLNQQDPARLGRMMAYYGYFGRARAERITAISEHLAERGIPVMMDAPFGHVGPLWTLPVGGMAALDADTGELSLEQTA